MIKSAAVIGLGYVGLPTAAVFADAGLPIIGVDVDAAAVRSINAGKPHIVEPHLDALLRGVVDKGKLRATTVPEAADVYVIAVPTPFMDGKKPDLKFVRQAAEAIAPLLAPGALIILESTSPVGATERMASWLAGLRPDLSFPHQAGDDADIHVAHCPERVLPGRVLHEVVHNSRIIGGMSPACAQAAAAFYRHAVKGEFHLTDARTAELAKLSENAFRDLNIAFANELSLICHDLEIDPWELIDMANKHPRVNILKPGPGVGGHCIAVDPWFIVDTAPKTATLIRTARQINDGKPNWVADRVAEKLAGHDAPVIACMGLAYKPDVDDLRESPSVAVVEDLLRRRLGTVLVAEPYISELPAALAGADLVAPEEAVERADIAVFLTAHRAFRALPAPMLAGKDIIDTCGVLRG